VREGSLGEVGGGGGGGGVLRGELVGLKRNDHGDKTRVKNCANVTELARARGSTKNREKLRQTSWQAQTQSNVRVEDGRGTEHSRRGGSLKKDPKGKWE